MQTRKKFVVKNAATQPTNPRFCRNQKRMTVVAEKKVSDIITSSARKQKNAGIFAKKKGDPKAATNLNPIYLLEQVVNQDICMSYEPSLDLKRTDERGSQCDLDTIFSPAFHISKDAHGGISDEVDFMDFFGSKDELDHQDLGTVESKSDNVKSRVTCNKQEKISCGDVTTEPSPLQCDMNVITTDESDVQHNHGGLSLSDTTSANSSNEENIVGNLSSEVSAIYLAMQQSKLECIDEASQDSIISNEDCVEAEETDELDDFDPYMFIRNLPDLSTVVPTFRPMLLPKQTRSCPSTTLVLDLDETLVHSTLEPCEDADFTFPVNFNLKEHLVYVRCRPYLKDFMERVSSLFEIIIFTASQSIYAEQLLNILDPKRRLFRHRVYRESCVFVEGNFLKDLSVLGRDLARVIIIDNSPQAFGFQVDNGIPIESWFEDRSDQALPSLLPFLESLVGVKDVRPLIANKFNLREKIASAACFPH